MRKIYAIVLLILFVSACAAPQTPADEDTPAAAPADDEPAMVSGGCSHAFFPVEEGLTYIY